MLPPGVVSSGLRISAPGTPQELKELTEVLSLVMPTSMVSVMVTEPV